ncbi:MAG: chorismate synthase [Chitinivibrionales bacterium]
MIGCNTGRFFKVTVAGGSYQDGLTAVVQGIPPGMKISEKEIYGDLLLRKPGADILSSPRKEPDLPVIYSGINAEDTIENGGNKGLTNGTPLSLLIPNLDRHFIHIKQYQDTNRTPRPGHASYATFKKYGFADDAIGAGLFSGRYTSTIVGPGYIAKKILKECGIDMACYVKELAGVKLDSVSAADAIGYSEKYKRMRWDHDPFYQEVYEKGRIKPEMRFLEKIQEFTKIENEISDIRAKAPSMDEKKIEKEYGVHHILNCPDIDVSNKMVEATDKISKTGDSAGGVVEMVIRGVPAGLGEPVFEKMDSELGRILGIGAVKGVEIGAGYQVKDMTGHECNDQMHGKDGSVYFDSNNAGGITGGVTTGQDIILSAAVKPTPTIDKDQTTVDKYTGETTKLSAITRRDPTIVARIWPVIENYAAMVVLDQLIAYWGYEKLKAPFQK